MNKRGFAQILVVIAVVTALSLLGLAGYLFIARQATNPTSSAPLSYESSPVDQTQSPVPAVKSASDLNTVSSDLDQTDLDSMDSDLNKNTADSAGF